MGGDRNTIHLLRRDTVETGAVETWPVMTKNEVAVALVERIAKCVGETP